MTLLQFYSIRILNKVDMTNVAPLLLHTPMASTATSCELLESLPTKFYKLLIKGIVYLVDPETAVAYLFDPVAPVAVGTVNWLHSSQVPELTLYTK